MPLFKWLLNLDDKDEREYRFEASIPSESLTFSIKMHYVDYHKNYYDIYLLSSKSVTIKFSLYFLELGTRMQKCFLTNKTETKDNYFALHCNKWQYLNTSDISILTKESLIFYYDIKKNEKDLCSRTLGNNYSTMLRGGEFSDIVIIKSIEGQEHKVHKAMLTSSSEVLKAHFEHDTTESNTHVVQSPLENLVLVDVLAFIYCNIAPNIEDMPEELLLAADYYQLKELKSLCEEKLKEKLCVDNALNTLQLAVLHSAEGLKQFILEYIKHEIKLIIKTDGWAKMDPTPLIKDVIEYIGNNGDIKCVRPEC